MEAWRETLQMLVCQVSVALVIALALSPAIREVTAGLTGTLGERWPFVLEHCRSLDTPGCQRAEASAFLEGLAVR